MKVLRPISFVFLALMMCVFFVSAQGQTSVRGIEVSAGHSESDDVYAWVCYGRTSGDITGNFTLSMNYAAQKTPGGFASISEGTWTLPIYSQDIKGESYKGMVYGNIQAGVVVWDKSGNATIQLKLLIVGGTEGMTDVHGTGIFYGTVTENPPLPLGMGMPTPKVPPTMVGTLTFNWN